MGILMPVMTQVFCLVCQAFVTDGGFDEFDQFTNCKLRCLHLHQQL